MSRRALLVLTLALVGCPDEPDTALDAGVAAAPPVRTERDAGTVAVVAAARPAWVDVDASFEARKLSATGKVQGIKNPGLRRATADNRARAAMSSRYQRFVARLGAELEGDTFDPKPFAASLISGVQIVDHWEDASNDVLYARAELDFAPFFEAIAKDTSIPAKERERLLAAAERAWEGLDED